MYIICTVFIIFRLYIHYILIIYTLYLHYLRIKRDISNMVHPFMSQKPKLEFYVHIFIFFDIGMLGSNIEVHKLIGHVMAAHSIDVYQVH